MRTSWNKGKTYIVPKRRRGIYKICYCGKSFYCHPSEISKKYHSQTCANRANAPKLSQDRIGANNPRYGKRPWNYKDGNSGHRPYNFIYWNWRRQVFLRDKQVCQNCLIKLRRKDCIAHHIKSWSDYPELRYIINNGITYCRSCHNKIDPKIKFKQF